MWLFIPVALLALVAASGKKKEAVPYFPIFNRTWTTQADAEAAKAYNEAVYILRELDSKGSSRAQLTGQWRYLEPAFYSSLLAITNMRRDVAEPSIYELISKMQKLREVMNTTFSRPIV